MTQPAPLSLKPPALSNDSNPSEDQCQPPTESINKEAEVSGPRSHTECARILRQLCPACFGGEKHGRPLEEYVFPDNIMCYITNNCSSGGDFQVATDGNFHHRHLKSGGESTPFHDPKHIIPKSFVDAVGDLIQNARKSPSKKRNPKVPDAAVDECEKSHDAADGDKKSTSNEGRYDDMGWMSLVCRHDIPLFFANIDTPGEQQKYSIALILWFFELIPSHATTTVLYDIGCVLDRSVQMVSGTFFWDIGLITLFIISSTIYYHHTHILDCSL